MNIPNVAIYLTEDERLMMLKFENIDGMLDVTICELSEYTDPDTLTEFPELREDQVCFARIAYEFDFDDENGIMEMALHEVVDLHMDGDPVCVEQMVNDNIEFMGEVYIEHIDNFYSY